MGAHEDTHYDYLDDPEEADEALSLCDLPLDENDGNMSTSHSTRRSTSSSNDTVPEFFEFLSNLSSEMRAAEDIIFCGKLIPFNEQNLPSSQEQQEQPLRSHKIPSNYVHKQGSFRRRSESLSELQSSTSRSNSTKSKILRSSRSLDYQKLRRVSSSKTLPDSDIERNSSGRSVGSKSDRIRVVKPRWSLFMFGIVKFPPEMDLRDMKSRQFRRNSTMMFPSLDAPVNSSVNRSSGGKTSWKFLKALSCRDDACVAVARPLCMPHA